MDIAIYALSEYAVTMEFSVVIDGSVADLISRFNAHLLQHPFPGLQTLVPAYGSLTIVFDPLVVVQATILPGSDCLEKVSTFLKVSFNQFDQETVRKSAAVIKNIPVCYGGGYGPDLDYLASILALTTNEVVQLHSSAIYRVFMIGFVPGFAYLGGLDHRLEIARKGTPRNSVPAGSVGIAGKQTGIYSLETPGGWQIIGRTPLRMFDANRKEPVLLKAGDRVSFTTITEKEFNQYKEARCE
ncbi:inhibitor of KinA [bacterium A37T11]|nr:inhibitor of KinA [bacterium A37T11]